MRHRGTGQHWGHSLSLSVYGMINEKVRGGIFKGLKLVFKFRLCRIYGVLSGHLAALQESMKLITLVAYFQGLGSGSGKQRRN